MTTVLQNSIHIDAPPARVWEVLTSLELLEQYDPGIARSRIVSEQKTGLGSARQCDLKPGGWFRERVSHWRAGEELAFELYECTLPVRSLEHRYVLAADGTGTRVEQRMQYRLKLGPLGALLDALVVRRKWDAGVKAFFAGLKAHAERR